MKKEFITEQQRDLFKRYLTKEDFLNIEKEVEKGQSTIQGILKRTTKVSDNNKCVVDAFYITTYKNMIKEAKFIKSNLAKVKSNEAVKSFISNNG